MTDVMSQIVSEVRSNRFTTIPTLSDDDVFHVWEGVSLYIERHMNMQKGVQIPGLGVFTFSQTKLEVGNNKFILIQRPVFQLSEKFAQTHHLAHVRHHVSGHIPVVQLNYTVLSMESPFDRDLVERCVKEVLQAVSKSVQKNSNVEITFSGIGRLNVRNSKAKMRFFKEFITSMDKSGNLMNAFMKRRTASSALSIVTGNTPRPLTSSTTAFPKIVETTSTEAPLSLEKSSSPKNESQRSRRSSQEPMPAIPEGAIVSQNNSSSSEDETDTHPTKTVESKSSPPPADTDQSQQSPQEGANHADSTPKLAHKTLTPKSRSNHSRASTVPASRPPTCSHGPQAGQELCYLCHQREARNIPVSFAEERQARETYQDRLLQHYQQQKDSLAIAREQAREAKLQQINRTMAKFNLERSEIRKAQKRRPPWDREYQPSYVFDRRPLTEPLYARQERYSKELDQQVSKQKECSAALKQEQDVIERLEQIQLAEELAASREAYLHDKAMKSYHYQQALAEQVCYKPEELPAAESDSAQPIFGIHDATEAKLRESRRRAQDIFHDQLCAENQKTEEALKRHRQDRQEDQKMLERTKRELRDEERLRRGVRLDGQRNLEQSWFDSVNNKRQREAEEFEFDNKQDILLHEQCNKYERCHQCQRRKENVGKSNIMKETRYIAGSRIIV